MSIPAAHPSDSLPVLTRQSFIELAARERAVALLDAGTAREILGPFDRLESPWLEPQGVVPQSDDGVVVLRGRIDGQPAVVLAIECAFLGGAVGEVSGAKIAGALDLALGDAERGSRTQVVLLLETGGVRLQEANLGLAAIAEVNAAIVALRSCVTVVCVIAGMVGCFGGMSIAAGLCSYLIATRQARLGLNGPEVIEQEAGVAEFDASDRALVWSVTGGTQRAAAGMVDMLVTDDVQEICQAIRQAFQAGMPARYRSAAVDLYRTQLAAYEPAQSQSQPGSPITDLHGQRATSGPGMVAEPNTTEADVPSALPAGRLHFMPVSGGATTPSLATSRGRRWFEALTAEARPLARYPASVLVADHSIGKEPARFLAVVPDPENRFPRARHGEVGLDEAWGLAAAIREVIMADAGQTAPGKRAIVAIVDVPSQAYGRLEEMLGIHLACAAASDAYATARLAGHPVIALIVGHAFSGGFLAHGAQANRLLALDDPGVMVHAMGKDAAARVTRRSVAELDTLAGRVLPMAYDIRSYARLGMLHALIRGVSAADPGPDDVARVWAELAAAIADARSGLRDLSGRLTSLEASRSRAASITVREQLAAAWDG
jgi:malonate decarboxylase beta subunit